MPSRPRELYTNYLGIWLSADQDKKVKRIADICGTTVTSIIRWLIEDEYDRNRDYISFKKYNKVSDVHVNVRLTKTQGLLLSKLSEKYAIDKTNLIRLLIDEDYERRFGNGE